jgi:hypothetical protein
VKQVDWRRVIAALVKLGCVAYGETEFAVRLHRGGVVIALIRKIDPVPVGRQKKIIETFGSTSRNTLRRSRPQRHQSTEGLCLAKNPPRAWRGGGGSRPHGEREKQKWKIVSSVGAHRVAPARDCRGYQQRRYDAFALDGATSKSRGTWEIK